jgi:multimeric flavodoxin WrbA/nitrite reductase/ring-hydroxylating ferredoxin subunit
LSDADWQDLGAVSELRQRSLQQIALGRTKIALSHRDGVFGAVSGVCNHAAGPLGEGKLEGDFVVCPWHHWKFHRVTGQGEPGYEMDQVPRYALKEEGGRLLVDLASATPRKKQPHERHPLERPIVRQPGRVRLLGLSTTAMDAAYPRFSTSDSLLEVALDAAAECGAETRILHANTLKFRHCDGYYSKSAQACTWPCSITQMDAEDQMEQVYEALVFWCDAVILSSPIRWGSASSLYFKLIERMNCIQNQVTIRDRVLIRNKVAAFIITGGQDNVQSVAGQMLMFVSELGFDFPQFPFIASSRGWAAEDMERNVTYVMRSPELREGARALAQRAVEKASQLVAADAPVDKTARGGRKAHHMEIVELDATPGSPDAGRA